MGFFLRKSVRVGPLRFNLSKSGLGVSAGLKGFRVGTGPRGGYVFAGRGGFYYRQSLGSRPSTARVSQSSDFAAVPTTPPGPKLESPPVGVDDMVEIDSGNVAQMVDSSADALVAELRRCARLPRLSVLMLLGGCVVGFLLIALNAPRILISVTALLTCVAAIVAATVDARRRVYPLTYKLEPVFGLSWDALLDTFTVLSRCCGLWHVQAEGNVRDKKYHAGADKLSRRTATSITFKGTGPLRVNLSTPTLALGRQKLVFLPDTILAFDGKNVGAVAYEDLEVTTTSINFIEEGQLPRDATVVNRTWRYVNKGGGPDRRFANNPELPVALYGETRLKSRTGLNEAIEASQVEPIENLKTALASFAQAVRNAKIEGAKAKHEAPALAAPLTLHCPCPHCGKILAVPAKFRGVSGTCNHCHKRFTVPAG